MYFAFFYDQAGNRRMWPLSTIGIRKDISGLLYVYQIGALDTVGEQIAANLRIVKLPEGEDILVENLL